MHHHREDREHLPPEGHAELLQAFAGDSLRREQASEPFTQFCTAVAVWSFVSAAKTRQSQNCVPLKPYFAATVKRGGQDGYGYLVGCMAHRRCWWPLFSVCGLWSDTSLPTQNRTSNSCMIHTRPDGTSYVESDFIFERLSGRIEVDHVHRSPGILAVLLHNLAVCGLARARRPHHHLRRLLDGKSRRQGTPRDVKSMLILKKASLLHGQRSTYRAIANQYGRFVSLVFTAGQPARQPRWHHGTRVGVEGGVIIRYLLLGFCSVVKVATRYEVP